MSCSVCGGSTSSNYSSNTSPNYSYMGPGLSESGGDGEGEILVEFCAVRHARLLIFKASFLVLLVKGMMQQILGRLLRLRASGIQRNEMLAVSRIRMMV